MYKRERDFLKNYSKEEAAGREEELNWRLIEARWKCETWMKTTTNERCQCYLGSRVEMMVKKYFLNIYYNSDLNLYQIVWYMWKIFKFSRAPRERHLKQLSSSSLKLPPQQQPTKEETTVIVFFISCTIVQLPSTTRFHSLSISSHSSLHFIGNEEYCPHYYEKKASNIIQAQYCSHYNNTRRGSCLSFSLSLSLSHLPSSVFGFPHEHIEAFPYYYWKYNFNSFLLFNFNSVLNDRAATAADNFKTC